MIAVTEATFGRRVLRADLPVLVCFATRACSGWRALRPALARLSAAHRGRLDVATLLLDGAPLLAEEYGLTSSPTLMVFAQGDRQGQAVGFLPPGLLDLLAEDAIAGAVSGGQFWSPVEERFEDAVLLPLLTSWGLSVERQVTCALPGRNRANRGRVDLLVREHPEGPPLTLVESKRQIRGEEELRQAVQQALAYARSLNLPSFVVAAPRGAWVYRREEERARCVRHLTSLELHERPEELLRLVVGAAGAAHDEGCNAPVDRRGVCYAHSR
jgi:thioredoxin 1